MPGVFMASTQSLCEDTCHCRLTLMDVNKCGHLSATAFHKHNSTQKEHMYGCLFSSNVFGRMNYGGGGRGGGGGGGVGEERVGEEGWERRGWERRGWG